MSFGEHCFIFAPIRGVTDLAYRNAQSRNFPGFDAALAPYFPLGRPDERLRGQLSQLRPESNLLRTEPQILANSVDHFLPLARELKAMGHERVSLDLGCPYPMVTDKKLGARLLAEPQRLIPLLQDLVEQSPIKLSLKIRLGYESSRDSEALVDVINRLDLEELTIHARVAKQLYGGTVDLDGFDRLAQRLHRVPTYNGDITSREAFDVIAARLPYVRRWMIGRGALRDPGLVARIKGESSADYSAAFRAFHDDVLEDLTGQSHLVDRMRGCWLYWSHAFEDPVRVFKRFKKARTLDDYHRAKDRAFAQATLYASQANMPLGNELAPEILR